MMKKVIFLVAALGILTGCSDDESNNNRPKERKDIQLSRAEQVMSEESTDFAFRFFQQVNSSETEAPNWMVSPLSASMALGMVTNGAGGNTLTEMKATLGFSEGSLDELNAYHRKLLTELPDLDNTTQLGLANSIWIKEGFEVKSPFVEVNRKMYDAEVRNLDFSSAQAPTVINNWCSDKTNGRISEVIKQINPDARMFLLNALYFKGIWAEDYKFNKSKTQKENFTCADGSLSKVQMMNQTNSYLFTHNDYFWMARFAYGNGAYKMTVLLPDAETPLEECLQALTAENWREWNKNWTGRTLKVKFPRFEMNYNKDLRDDMKALGMVDAFDPEAADFSSMADKALYIGLLQQFNYLKIDEEGTEAAAVTVVGGLTSEAPPTTGPIEFYLNRPFVFLITEASTGTVLFMGKITKL